MSEEKKCPKCKSGVKFRGSAVVEYFCYSHNRPDGSDFAQSHICKNRLITELESQLAKAITALMPFANATKFCQFNSDGMDVTDLTFFGHCKITVGYLRLASTTLAELRGGSSRSPAQAAGGSSPEIASTP
jgi:hypothetical protein